MFWVEGLKDYLVSIWRLYLPTYLAYLQWYSTNTGVHEIWCGNLYHLEKMFSSKSKIVYLPQSSVFFIDFVKNHTYMYFKKKKHYIISTIRDFNVSVSNSRGTHLIHGKWPWYIIAKKEISIRVNGILCPRLGAEWIGRTSWQVYQNDSRHDALDSIDLS